ncbi:MAG: hypothetical protein GOU98_00005, partial [Candidatus Altiarchaeota archaeon]|nr:hypothetical protein [Candidatus Altiarchaeota archaeon]
MCTLTLTNANTMEIIETTSLEFLSNLPIKKTYSNEPELTGEGQSMYYFEVSCNNQKSLLCKTDEKIRTRSALVTVNYTYSSEKLTLLGAVKARIEALSTDLNKQLIFENNSNQLITNIKTVVPTTLETTDLVNSQFYLLNQAKDKYGDQDFVGAMSLLDKIYIPNMESEWIANNNQLFQYNQNVQILRFLLNNSFDETYSFYQKTDTLRATQMKTLYTFFDNSPKSSFEEIVKLSGLSQIKLNLINLTQDYDTKKTDFENELRIDLSSIYSLLNLNVTLNGELCLDVETINDKITTHNQNLITYDVSLDTYLNFINTSLPKLSSNATHLIGTTSIPNDSGKSLSELMGYVSIEKFDYCETKETLYSNSFITGQVFFTPNLDVLPTQKLGLPASKCCVYGVCTTCEETPYPILLLHGHASNKDNPPESSINAFSKIQKQLSLDNLVINAGDIDYDSVGGG